MKPERDRRIDRRTFIRDGLIVGAGLAAAGLAISELADATDGSPSDGASGSPSGGAAPAASQPNSTQAPPRGSQPNILVILVDQLRSPQWFGPAAGTPGLPENLERLRSEAVSFERHYTASNDCSPARATLLTGLYTHQTGCMITGGSTLDPGFPTWGSMLRDYGYHTRWYGKWHLTHGDNNWTPRSGGRMLERYGFGGGIFPSPDGAPGQGWRVDPGIAGQFEQWLSSADESRPWCTTVSFVNPHDIAWWYEWSDRVATETQAPSVVGGLPPNFETPEALAQGRKPRLQISLQETAAASFGPVPFSGPEAQGDWLSFLDLYMKLQNEVDRHIGRVLDALARRPSVAANTVVVFTSDHGEYGASHGLRGKGAGAYEEAIRVPLMVRDPRGELTSALDQPRTQLSSSVDVAPLLLTIASGSDEWRTQRHYAQIADRLDLAAILADPHAAGRPYVLHATDETVTEFATEPYAASAPLHVVALRTPDAKLATYSDWIDEGIEPAQEGQERELYDYRSPQGQMELRNDAGQSKLEGELSTLLEQAYGDELRRPLPPRLNRAAGRGFFNYFTVATRIAARATARRAERQAHALKVRRARAHAHSRAQTAAGGVRAPEPEALRKP